MAGRTPKRKTRRRLPRGRFLLRWLGVAVIAFVAFLYSQPLRNYFSTRDALAGRAHEVHVLRAQKVRLQQQLAQADTPEALTRQARALGYVKPGERLFIVKGINAWRRQHEQSSK
ncbi:MAG: septum formation initiator family protein [Actinomycetota bacterium]